MFHGKIKTAKKYKIAGSSGIVVSASGYHKKSSTIRVFCSPFLSYVTHFLFSHIFSALFQNSIKCRCIYFSLSFYVHKN